MDGANITLEEARIHLFYLNINVVDEGAHVKWKDAEHRLATPARRGDLLSFHIEVMLDNIRDCVVGDSHAYFWLCICERMRPKK